MHKITFLLTVAIIAFGSHAHAGVLEDVLTESACSGNSERIRQLFQLDVKIDMGARCKDDTTPLACAESGDTRIWGHHTYLFVDNCRY